MDEDVNEDVVDYQCLFPGASITLPQCCTASDGRPCHIIYQLPACNKLLSSVECKLDEKIPDKLSLVSASSWLKTCPTEATRREACALIFWLLKSHRCLDTVELVIDVELQVPEEHQRLILRSLRAAPALRKLKISAVPSSLSDMPELSCLSSLPLLETLECSTIDCREMAAVLRPVLEASFSLTTLSLHVNAHTVMYGHELWAAMATCKALNTLQVYFWYSFTPTEDDCVLFYEYLEKISTLTSIHVAHYPFHHARGLKYALRALYGKKELLNVILEKFVVDVEEGIAIENFLNENYGIRTFELKWCSWRNDGVKAACYDTDDFGTLTPRILPWLAILKTNHALQTLRVNFHGFSPAECSAFLEQLVRNRNLRTVSIEDFQEFFRCVSHRGHNARKLGTMHDRRPEKILGECKQIRQVRLDMRTSKALEWFVTSALPLELCHRVAEFKLCLEGLNPTQEGVSAIAEFIKASNTLALLGIHFGYSKNDSITSPMPEWRRTILRAVRSNSSIKELILWYPNCTVLDAEELAYTIGKSKTVCYLDLDLGPDAGQLFLTNILPSISRNYTLVTARMRSITDMGSTEYHYLLNVVARNRRLLARGAKFAAGSSSTPCAEAIEFVSSNPALVNELCELASLDVTEASRKISDSLRRLRDLDDFMQISGVVKRNVACHMKRNGDLQLDDVDDYSWRCVRKYLRLADVRK